MALHEAELWANKRWVLIPIAEGVKYAERRLRCPECHGAVRPFQSVKIASHYEHGERNPGCSKGDCFDGTPKPHRKALK